MDAYHRVWVTPTPGIVTDDQERRSAATEFRNCIQLREKYLYSPQQPEHLNQLLQSFQEKVRATPMNIPMLEDLTQYQVLFGENGIGEIVPADTSKGTAPTTFDTVPFTLAQFNADVSKVWQCCTGKLTRTFAFRRLRMLDVNYEFHTLMNGKSIKRILLTLYIHIWSFLF
mgnify:CR=1 FL=1